MSDSVQERRVLGTEEWTKYSAVLCNLLRVGRRGEERSGLWLRMAALLKGIRLRLACSLTGKSGVSCDWPPRLGR